VSITRPLRIGSVVFTLALAIVSLLFIPSTAEAATREVLIAPFADGPTAATTQNSYSGNVRLRVSGFGQAAGTQCSDAFYIFTESSGEAGVCGEGVSPVPANEFGLFINNQPAENFIIGSAPPFRRSHVYHFTISVAGGPLRLTFGVGDTFTSDNSGQYRIVVSQRR
jgi:hypothetical protein